ncbi:YraN family protein [Spirochaeta cellobiosiphila]|uniref:YraN family protein n=1 Tax=Spirochaeta cellobiosiphila TaxID=504483 RepID=UPI00041F87BB|nr:YraN family protein [Spirochaeta cellobiosiphila]
MVIGQWGEEIASKWLVSKGCKIIKRNFRSPYGEVDIIVSDGDEIVFVEVKTWNTLTEYDLEFSISKTKRDRIIKTAKFFLVKYNQEPWVRFDVIFINGDTIKHYKNAFSEF